MIEDVILSKLSRDYSKYPVLLKEHINRDDLYYLYIDCNLTAKEIANFIQRPVRYVENQLSNYSIKKPKHLSTICKKLGRERMQAMDNDYNEKIKEKIRRTNLKRYGGNAPSCNPLIKEKIRRTNLKRYGGNSPTSCKNVREKIKNTFINRYGVENISQLDETKEKIKHTISKKYGYDYFLSIPEIRETIKKTCQHKYGGNAPTSCTNVIKKIKKTNIERYGVEYSSQSDEIKEKIKQSNLERYGVEYSSQSDEIKEKIKQTNLERYGVEWYVQSEMFDFYKAYPHISENSKNILMNKELFNDMLKECNNNYVAAKKLNVSIGTIYRHLHLYDLSTQYINNKRSHYEDDIIQYIQSIYTGDIITNCKILNGKEIDIFLPDINIGIEFNGDYWHSEEILLKKGYDPQFYHLEKTILAYEHDIFLYHIFEHEFIFEHNKIINELTSVINNTTNIDKTKYHAEQLTIEEYNRFINDFLTSSSETPTSTYGIYYNDQVIYTLGINIHNNCVNIINEYSTGFISNRIAFNIVLNKIISTLNPQLITYIINLHNQSLNDYVTNGFKIEKYFPPSYKYIDNHKIYDCGQFLLKLSIDNTK